METIWWKTRVTSERMFEMMKFLRAYFGRSTRSADYGAPVEKEYPLGHVLLRAVERCYDGVLKQLQDRARDPHYAAEKAANEWWLKMARDGRNGDPFPGVSYGPPGHDCICGGKTGLPANLHNDDCPQRAGSAGKG